MQKKFGKEYKQNKKFKKIKILIDKQGYYYPLLTIQESITRQIIQEQINEIVDFSWEKYQIQEKSRHQHIQNFQQLFLTNENYYDQIQNLSNFQIENNQNFTPDDLELIRNQREQLQEDLKASQTTVSSKPKLRLNAKAFIGNEFQVSLENTKPSQKQVKRKPIVLEETQIRYQGTVKYFDEQKIYGFLVLDIDGSEVFFHMDDIKFPKLTKEFIMTYKQGNIIRFSFSLMKYIGKYKESLKATEMKLIQ